MNTIIQNSSLIVDKIKLTYLYFAGTMIAAATGSYLGVPIASQIAENFWFIAIPWMLAGMFGLSMIQKIPVINLIGLYLFSFVGGIILSPLLSHVFSIPNGAQIITNAFVMTAVLFTGLSLFAINTKTDFRSFGKPLIITFFVLILFSLFNLFFLENTLLQMLIKAAIFLVVSVLVIFDTQKIIMGDYTPIEGALMLFLDFFNLFQILLSFMGYGSDD